MIEALLPLALEAGKAGIGLFQAKNASKKAANSQRDYAEHTQRLQDVFNSNVEQYKDYFTTQDQPFLQSVIDNLQSQLDQNPYALDGESAPQGLKIEKNYNGVSIDLYNSKIKTLFEGYIDQKSSAPGVQNLTSEVTQQPASATQTAIDLVAKQLQPLISKDSVVDSPIVGNQSAQDYTLPVMIGLTGLIVLLIVQRR